MLLNKVSVRRSRDVHLPICRPQLPSCSGCPLLWSSTVLVAAAALVARCCPLVLVAHLTRRPLSPTTVLAARRSRRPWFWSSTVAHCSCRLLFLPPTVLVVHCPHHAHCCRSLLSLVLHCSRTSVFRCTLPYLSIKQHEVSHLKTQCRFFIISVYLHHLCQRCITQLIIAPHLRY